MCVGVCVYVYIYIYIYNYKNKVSITHIDLLHWPITIKLF